MSNEITFTTSKYADLTEIKCEAPAPICPTETHVVAVISHQPGTKWVVSAGMFGRVAFKTRKEAEAHVRGLVQ